MSAWIAPKRERRRFINELLQMQVNGIFCFRAKEKLKIVPGSKPEPLGWMPIAGEEFIYEMTAKALFEPMADGVPQWSPARAAEREMVKIPKQFRELFSSRHQMCEADGESLARWAEGTQPISDATKALLAEIYVADEAAVEALRPKLEAARSKMSKTEVAEVRAALTARKAVFNPAAPAPPIDGEPERNPAEQRAQEEPGASG